MGNVDPAVVFQMVKEWKQRPTKWKLFVRDLLVLLTKLRPVVFLDDIVFHESSALMHFLSSLSGRFEVQLTVLRCSDTEEELHTHCFCAFIADWEWFEVRRDGGRRVFLSLTEESARVVDGEEEAEINERMERLIGQISQRVREGQCCIDLCSIGKGNDLPTLSGCLLEYPIVYCVASARDRVITLDCIVCCLSLQCINLPLSDELFSFTVPFELMELQRVKGAMKAWKACWEQKLSDSCLVWQGLEFREERCCTHVLHF